MYFSVYDARTNIWLNKSKNDKTLTRKYDVFVFQDTVSSAKHRINFFESKTYVHYKAY